VRKRAKSFFFKRLKKTNKMDRSRTK